MSHVRRISSRPLEALVLGSMLVFASTSLANTIVVDPSGGGDVTSIAGGIEAAQDGDVVLVVPGTYDLSAGPLVLHGKAITLAAQDGPEDTILDANGQTSCIVLDQGESSGTEISGFSLTGAVSAAILVDGGSPTLQNLIFRENSCEDPLEGGSALRISSGSATVSSCQFLDNESVAQGGAVAVVNGTVTLEDVLLSGNVAATQGGGLYLANLTSAATLARVTFLENSAQTGGAIFTDATVQGTNLEFAANHAEFGGAVACVGGSLGLTNLTVAGNYAPESGAAVAGNGCTATFTNAVFAYNKAPVGGVIGQLDTEETSSYTFLYADFFRNGPDPFSIYPAPDADDILEIDPGFQYYVDDLSADGDDFHLFPGSALIDAGHPNEAFDDADGSRADIGVYGGPHADTDYAADTDGDNLPDSWERLHGLDPDTNDAAYDLDGDGLINLDEYRHGLLPEQVDTDGDTLSDRDEVAGGSNPRDAFDPSPTLTIPNDTLDTIQSAINAARDGVTIEVLPGTYAESLDFLGKNIELRATGGLEVTTLSGEDTFPVVALRFGEATALLEGFTISAGSSWDSGGGLMVSSSHVTVQSVAFTGNWAAGDGGAVWVHHGSVIGADLVFDSNYASDTGGAIGAMDGTISLTRTSFTTNYGFYGGGAVGAVSSEVSLNESTFSENTASGDGGAIEATTSQVSLTDTTFTENEATGDGGAIQVDGGSLDGKRVTFLYGYASGAGGGVHATGSATILLENLLIDAPTAYEGGAIALEASAQATLDHATIVGSHSSHRGGAIFVSGSDITLTHAIIAYNLAPSGGGVAAESIEETDDEGETVTIVPSVSADYTDVYGNRSGDYWGLDPLEGVGNLSVDPMFVRYLDDAQADGDDLHLRPESPLVDAGDPDGPRDPDGSIADLGTYGGPDADFSYYADADQDGMADGFEASFGLNPSIDDASDDPDGDGLTNAQEAQLASDPFEPDTDGDGLTDAEEAATGSDPVDAFSPSGWASVPGTFETIQGAINAAESGAEIRIEPGTYHENLNLLGKGITLTGTGTPDETVIDGSSTWSVITMSLAEPPETRIANLTIANGSSPIGGGIYLLSASPTLENLILRDNDATLYGGGLASQEGSPTLTDIQATNNSAGARGQGGALYFQGGAPVITRAVLTENTASSGAGVYLYGTSATIQNTLVAGNEATYGGGISIRYAETPTLVNVTSHSNSAAGGAGLFVESSTVVAINTVLTGNRAPVGAGILVRDEASDVRLSYCDLWGNYGEDYGGDVLSDQTGENDNVSVDPRYEAFSPDGEWSNDDLHLRPDSPLVHTGDPSLANPDGSRSDLGNYGGPEADRTYYQDLDADGMYDGWETMVGLNPDQDDASGDPDADGLSNIAEFSDGTDPLAADTDRDGIPDQEELSQGTDPSDFFSPNDTVVVNDYFDSIQDALDKARDGVTLLLEEGVYQERIDFEGKDVVLRGLGAPEKTIIDGDGSGPVVAFRYGEGPAARLERVTIRNGTAPDGGGIRIVQSSPSFDRVIVRNNTAVHTGGGLSIVSAAPFLTNCLIVDNQASEGGGIAAKESLPMLVGVTIAGNAVTGTGGGISLVNLCSPTILNSVIAFNEADNGGGVNIIAPQIVTFQNNDVYGNSLDNYSGTYSDQTGHNGNISEDPSFTTWNVADTPADFHPQPDSPLVDSGKDVSKAGITWDLDGIPRPADGDGDGEAQFDMGAYELEMDVDFDGFLPSEGDCDEGDPATYPGANEICDDGVDQDCDGEDVSCSLVDNDGDGFSEDQGDCNDEDASIYPGAEETDNGVDDNCDGEIDEGLESPSPEPVEDTGGCSCRTGASPREGHTPRTGAIFLGLVVFLAAFRRARRLPVSAYQRAGAAILAAQGNAIDVEQASNLPNRSEVVPISVPSAQDARAYPKWRSKASR